MKSGRSKRRMLASALALACLPSSACGPDGGRHGVASRPRHVVLVLLESVRADHAGAYGYARPTTPRLDALATQGVLFERAYAPSSANAQSLAALWTGRLPTRGGSTGLAAAPHPELATLPRLFLRAGFHVALASNHAYLRERGFTRGCDALEIDSEPGRWSGEQVTARALELAEGARGAPLFLIVDYADAAEPHSPPAEWRARIDVPAPEVPLTLAELRAGAGSLPNDIERASALWGDVERSSGFQDLVARYDAELARVDACLGALVDGLTERGLLDETLLVVTSSQGAEFLEHGFAGSGWTLFEEVLRVPLVVHAPRHLAPGRSAEPVSLVDLLPTLAGVFALERGEHELDGVSLLALGATGLQVRPRGAAVIAELAIPELCVQRAAIEGPWKLVETVLAPPPAERVALLAGLDERLRSKETPPGDSVPPAARRELYELGSDPRETRDVSASAAAELARLRAALERYAEACRRSGLAPRTAPRPKAEAESDPEAELRQLGYF